MRSVPTKSDKSPERQVCCVFGCTSRNDGRTYHPFPKDKANKQKWLDVIKNETLKSESSWVCSKHFQKSDFAGGAAKKATLKKAAVPSLKLMEPPIVNPANTDPNQTRSGRVPKRKVPFDEIAVPAKKKILDDKDSMPGEVENKAEKASMPLEVKSKAEKVSTQSDAKNKTDKVLTQAGVKNKVEKVSTQPDVKNKIPEVKNKVEKVSTQPEVKNKVEKVSTQPEVKNKVEKIASPLQAKKNMVLIPAQIKKALVEQVQDKSKVIDQTEIKGKDSVLMPIKKSEGKISKPAKDGYFSTIFVKEDLSKIERPVISKSPAPAVISKPVILKSAVAPVISKSVTPISTATTTLEIKKESNENERACITKIVVNNSVSPSSIIKMLPAKKTCVIPNCGNFGGHLFPKNPAVRKKWIDFVGVKNWKPEELSIICTKHFNANNYFFSSEVKGHLIKKLKPNAVPTIRVSNEDATVEKEQNLSPNINLNPKVVPKNVITSTQTRQDNSSQTPRLKLLTTHDLRNNSKAVFFYTGFKSFDQFKEVFTALGPDAHDLEYFYNEKPDKVEPFDQFLMTLIILRQHKSHFEMSVLFDVTLKDVKNIFITWVRFMRLEWNNLYLPVLTDSDKPPNESITLQMKPVKPFSKVRQPNPEELEKLQKFYKILVGEKNYIENHLIEDINFICLALFNLRIYKVKK